MRRVAFVVDRMGPGGKERVVMHLATELAAAGLEPAVFCLREIGRFGRVLRERGIAVESVHSARAWDILGLCRLAGLLRRFRPDVINVHDCSSLPYVVLANRLSGGCPVVLTCHGLPFAQRRLRGRHQRLAARYVQAVTAVSEHVASEYAELLRLKGPIEIIENGVPMQRRQDQLGAEVRGELGLSDDAFLFVAVGNLVPEKGYEDLLDACGLLRRRPAGRPFVVAVAGEAAEPEYGDLLEARARRLQLESMVRLLGYREDTLALYSAADAFVLPSRTEGLPMVLLEAMSAGLPVVASAVGGIPGILRRSGAGLLVEPGNPTSLADGMTRLLSDSRLRRDLGGVAAEFIRAHYTTRQMAERYLQVFSKVSAGERKRSDPRGRRAGQPHGVLMLGPLPPLTGGMATVMSGLRDSRYPDGFRMSFFQNGKTTPQGRLLLAGVNAQLRLLGRIAVDIAFGRWQIVHIHTCSGLAFWRDCIHAGAAHLLGARVVWHVHGGMFDEFAARQGRVGRKLMRLALTAASAVIVLSEDWVRRLRAVAPRARWRVVPNGVPVRPVPALPGDGQPVFLFLGNLGMPKGGRDLVEATAVAVARGFAGRVDLAGKEIEPGDAAALTELIRKHRCQSHVRLLGVVSGEAKARALASAWCMVLPSRAEGQPMAILEAMACGLPIISTKVGAIPEVITDGVEGFLIEPGDVEALADRLLRLEADAELRHQMGRAGRRRVEQSYSLDRMVERIVRVYREALGEAES